MRARAAATPGPRSRSRSARARRARTRVKAGSSLSGRPTRSRPCARSRLAALRAAHAEEGTAEAAAGGRHPGEGPAAGTAGEAEQHLLGLVVEGVAEEHGGGAVPVGGLVEGGVAGRAGGGLEAVTRGGRPRRSRTSTGSRPRARRRSAASAATCGRAGLEAVVDDDRAGAPPGRGASKAVAAASASESAPPLHATSTRSPGARASASGARTAWRTAPSRHPAIPRRSCRPSSRHGSPRGVRDRVTARVVQPRAQPWTRRTQASGSSISRASGRVSGEDQTALKPSTPTLS